MKAWRPPCDGCDGLGCEDGHGRRCEPREPICPCGQRLDTYEELKATGNEMDAYIADAYLGPGGFYCANEDDVVPPEYVAWRAVVRKPQTA